MTGIPYFEDLSAQEMYDALDLKWVVSEKLDGTFLEIGLDADDQFYVKRKGGQPIYSESEWPQEAWANTYRNATKVAKMLVETLVASDALQAGQHFGVELLDGPQPNTVVYSSYTSATASIMVVTTVSFEPTTDFYVIIERFLVPALRCTDLYSYDGKSYTVDKHYRSWVVRYNNVIDSSLIDILPELKTSAEQMRSVLQMWVNSPSSIDGFTNLEVLEAKLNTRHPKCGDRNWNELKTELKAARAELQAHLKSLGKIFSIGAYSILNKRITSRFINFNLDDDAFNEGFVVTTPSSVFKIMNKEEFVAANRFTHLVKYWLVGGRRPARPCFLSRTKDWPVEKRLARLEQLITRFEQNKTRLRHNITGKRLTLMYTDQLYRRTMNMFADTYQRIKDGR